jgi:hypothetical protein
MIKGGEKMKTNKIKKTLCAVMILSFVGGWFNVNICGAEEGQQRLPEGIEQNVKESTEKGESKNQLEEFARTTLLVLVLSPVAFVALGLVPVFMVISITTGDQRYNPIPH